MTSYLKFEFYLEVIIYVDFCIEFKSCNGLNLKNSKKYCTPSTLLHGFSPMSTKIEPYVHRDHTIIT